MIRSVSRRRLVASAGTVLVAAALPTGVVAALATETPSSGPVLPTTFDAVAFLADMKAAGCRVCLALPASVFRPEDDWSTYFIAPSQGYAAVMAKWSDAMAAYPDAHERVVARLVEMKRGGIVKDARRDETATEAREIVRRAVGDAAGLTIKAQLRQAARNLGYVGDTWRLREALYRRAGTWCSGALEDLRRRFTAWRQKERARSLRRALPTHDRNEGRTS
ncbi:MAG: hypothetical protein ACRYGP_06325 [Janthinobacterium lividum]